MYAEDSPDSQKRFVYQQIVSRLKMKENEGGISYRSIAAETGVAVQTVINIKNRLKNGNSD
ncbi:trp operon repressor [Levilactobacillus brevis]|uniref:trp operon repressor n=1 Tax=Levilactobacillus brevis TaxID=1580 RepID=UPI001BDE9E82|nr:trp operon repressor [Levilactobacillus brevis]